MTARQFALRAASVTALLAIASAVTAAPARTAPAPAAPAAPAAPPITYGPPLQGICVVSRNDVLAASQVGRAFSDRMTVLQNQIQAELQPQATALQADQNALRQAATPDQTRIAAFNLKASQFQQLEQQRGQQLDATRQKQVQRLYLELQPVLQQVFQQKQCTILFEREGIVIGVNPAMDLTQASILGLNARIQTITFDLEPPGATPPGQPGQ
jgi:outer membrane protein